LRRFHGNALNILDSLQMPHYTLVMSIAEIDHYSNGGPTVRASVGPAVIG
jgi:hypothetical protein